MIKEQCKKNVWRGYCSYSCSKKVWKDGYCKQHHPDTVKERYRQSQLLYEEKAKRSSWYKLQQAEIRIAELKAEIARLKKTK